MSAPSPTAGPVRSVLVVEDESDVAEVIRAALTAEHFDVTVCGTGGAALDAMRTAVPDALVMDVQLPDLHGQVVLERALHRYPDLVAVMMTGYGGVPDAVAAIRTGAIDFLIKPFQLAQLSLTLANALEQRRLREENARLKAQIQERHALGSIIGQSAAMRRMFAALELAAPLMSTVLIQGETGTGKELVARTLHERSSRADQRFVAINAAAIPESLFEAELFGHARGAFTGAVAARVGRLELAHRGSLFIDEVGLMPLPLQSKLLRVLQEREFERVGESKSVSFDARIIAATNADLFQRVREGRFREDLYYRLNVIRIALPPLRDRLDDIPLLARHFVQKVCQRNGLPPKILTQNVVRRLMTYSWPGNIREVENAIEYAVAMSGSEREVPLSALPDVLTLPPGQVTVPSVNIPDEGLDFTAVVSQLERELILRGLEKSGGNKRRAARLLSLSRTTFIDKLNRLRIDQGEDTESITA